MSHRTPWIRLALGVLAAAQYSMRGGGGPNLRFSKMFTPVTYGPRIDVVTNVTSRVPAAGQAAR